MNAAYDTVTRETFFGPPGGGVEFGERAADAVRREMREELGADLEDVRLIGVLENIFEYEGRPGHEITFVFVARFADPAFYDREEIPGVEEGQAFVARWIELERFAPGGPPLYPVGLYELLRRSGGATFRPGPGGRA